MDPLTVTLIEYVSTKLLDQFIAQEGYGWLKRLFIPKKKYQTKLVEVIYKTIDEFEKINLIDNNVTDKFPFYHSQILFEEFNKYILFKKFETITTLKEKLKQNPNIIIPTDEEINEFYKIFIHKIEQDKELKKLFIKENYQEEIFNISNIIKRIYNRIGFLPGNKWFEIQCNRSIDDLGKRYTPELNIELNISDNFEAIGRTQRFEKKILEYLDNLLIKGRKVISRSNKIDEIKGYSLSLNLKLEEIYKIFIETNFKGTELLPIAKIQQILDDIDGLSNKIEDYFYSPERKRQEEKKDYNYYHKYAYEINNVREFNGQLYDISNLLNSKELELSNNPFLLLYGNAGIGKSHLLGDVINRRIKAGYRSIFILGQHLNTKEDPRIQILKKLQVKVSFNEFLNTLNELAEREQKRIIIFIDAINEGQGKYFWSDNIKSFINEIKDYKWLGLVLTIRTSYKELILPDELLKELDTIQVRHHGFSGVEYEASKLFFSNYGIEYPNTPLLHPEFQNPLFLKLFCEGLTRNGLTRMPKGLQGITAIIDFFINGINSELSKPKKLDYSASINLVKKSIEAIINYKIENGERYIPYEKAYDIIESIASKYTTKKGVVEYLISEGIFSKNLFWKEKDDYVEGIYLAYERFEDHLTACYLLEKFDNIENEFKKDGNLFYLVKDEHAISLNKGLIDALTIQLPERINKELFELIPHLKESYDVAESLIESLLWRKVESITDNTKKYLKDYGLKYQGTYDLFWETVISISSIPQHPFNALWLHNVLMKYSLSERDARWTPYLKDKFYDDYAVKRLIDWAWNDDDKSHISNESIKLASITLTLFHTSTNRKLRDSATKAMVSLFQDRINVLIDLLMLFEKVNDPYVYERLYAVAYGAALRTEQKDKLPELAEYIYKTIFKDKEEVYPHALLRDYARGVIEYTVHLAYELSFNINEVRPPYKSNFPERLPTNEEIDSKYKLDYNSKDFKDYHWGQNSILSSMVTEYGRGVASYGDFGRYTFESALRSFEVDANLLSNLAIKWIFEKYGYDVEKHGKHDRNIHFGGRHEHRIERIGKKYQWIAFYEMVARVSDNFKKYDSWYSQDKKENPYQGPWDPYVRDIDPTILIKKTGYYNKENPTQYWWTKENYSNWALPNEEWIKKSDDLPYFENTIQVLDENGEEWIVLEGYPEWAEPKPIGKEKWDNPHKRLWTQIRSYLVKKEKSKKIIEWAKEQNFMGRWMPESSDRYEIFSREYYWSPADKYFLNEYYNGNELREIIDPRSHAVIDYVTVTTESFLWEEKFDFSKEGTLHFLKPCNAIYQGMNLYFSRNEGEFVNENNEIICFAANVNYNSKSLLLVKKKPFFDFLEKNGLDIFWTILGERQIIGGMSARTDYVGRLDISGTYYLENDKIIGNINVKEE